ncbi:hypothetical protein ZIOFF_030499 [Zingiber officinale]|uniref:Subtilisin-like protease fibronectin type-III domain-containing protein n=1 Tax=Zingiber officinale TaxID=94328 RepID=A0A8J5GR17_ZINOF|nr:hypothetical protein ZIOFF_030499 [Zingiber officinale]
MPDELLKPALYFAKGAGHVNPNKATDPGLIYDITSDDYISYICGKFGKEGARTIARGVVDCSKTVTEEELNYPSILLAPKAGAAAKVSRVVTNVGPARSSYTVSMTISKIVVSAIVIPEMLTFTELNEQKSFTLSVEWGADGPPTSGIRIVEGKLTWTSNDDLSMVGLWWKPAPVMVNVTRIFFADIFQTPQQTTPTSKVCQFSKVHILTNPTITPNVLLMVVSMAVLDSAQGVSAHGVPMALTSNFAQGVSTHGIPKTPTSNSSQGVPKALPSDSV